MKPIFPDCVVFYSVSECHVYDVSHLPEGLPFDSDKEKSLPSDVQIDAIQAQLDHESLVNKKHILIVVPDAWLSISEHQLDHPLSKKLAPLAALAFATETTFAPPDSIFYYYRVTKLSKQSSRLNIVACSRNTMEHLSLPFQKSAKCSGIISQQQWLQRPHHRFNLILLSHQYLAVYQPEEKKQQNARKRWICLVLASVVLHVAFFTFFYSINTDYENQRIEQQTAQAQQIVLPKQGNIFVGAVLATLRTMPREVRLSSFQSKNNTASIRLSLPEDTLQPLLTQWRQKHPNWRWQMSIVQSGAGSLKTQEVIDVDLIVSTF